MSTKSTIAYGPTFHLYHDLVDERYVTLELEGVPFHASYDKVVVPIPVHVWETIRMHPGVDLSLADASDDDLRERVERDVDERLARLVALPEGAQRGLATVFGMIPYGMADTPRADQVEHGMTYFRERRAYQQQVRRAIDRLQATPDEPHDGI
jgi:hypothetical protein